MKLKSLKIENFKSIENSGEFSIDEITCLVGKNEAGKSAILQALYKLNPVEKDASDFLEEEYPRRHQADYEDRLKTVSYAQPANVLTTTWELSEEESKAVEKGLGPGTLKSRTITITKGYSNMQLWIVPIDEKKVIDHYLKNTELYKEELDLLKSAKTMEQIITTLEAIESPSERQANLLTHLEQNFRRKRSTLAAIDILDEYLPTFLYFAEYQRMAGRVPIDSLVNTPKDSLEMPQMIFLALLAQVGTTPEELQSIGTFERFVAKFEAISNRLSREIFQYWSQNRHLRVRFSLDPARPQDSAPYNKGLIFNTRIWNDRHEVSVNFDDRSTGFIWFFSFLIWLSQVKRNYGDRLIILLDEPGLSLHARAQGDLLRYIKEKLQPHYQVIYTTHSPFMIDPENILGARTVEDVVEQTKTNGDVVDIIKGTKVNEDVLSTDRDTLFPLQGALGYDITQTLFVGKNTLLVEGPSDLLYLTWFRNELRSLKREYLDLRWTITPSEGLTKIGSFVALFGGNKLHIAVLTDLQEGEKKKVRDLKESKLLMDGHVFSAEMYAGQSEADIEDLLGRDFYVDLVNRCYGLQGANKLLDIKPPGAPIRVVKEVEDHFRTLPANVPEFDHYAPAVYLLEKSPKSHKGLPGMAEALDRFESLFRDLNKLLD